MNMLILNYNSGKHTDVKLHTFMLDLYSWQHCRKKRTKYRTQQVGNLKFEQKILLRAFYILFSSVFSFPFSLFLSLLIIRGVPQAQNHTKTVISKNMGIYKERKVANHVFAVSSVGFFYVGRAVAVLYSLNVNCKALW